LFWLELLQEGHEDALLHGCSSWNDFEALSSAAGKLYDPPTPHFAAGLTVRLEERGYERLDWIHLP